MSFECHDGHISILYGSEPCPLCASHRRIEKLEAIIRRGVYASLGDEEDALQRAFADEEKEE